MPLKVLFRLASDMVYPLPCQRKMSPSRFNLFYKKTQIRRPALKGKFLFFQETSLKDDAAAINLAVNLLRILSQTDASDLGTTLDDH